MSNGWDRYGDYSDHDPVERIATRGRSRSAPKPLDPGQAEPRPTVLAARRYIHINDAIRLQTLVSGILKGLDGGTVAKLRVVDPLALSIVSSNDVANLFTKRHGLRPARKRVNKFNYDAKQAIAEINQAQPDVTLQLGEISVFEGRPYKERKAKHFVGPKLKDAGTRLITEERRSYLEATFPSMPRWLASFAIDDSMPRVSLVKTEDLGVAREVAQAFQATEISGMWVSVEQATPVPAVIHID